MVVSKSTKQGTLVDTIQPSAPEFSGSFFASSPLGSIGIAGSSPHWDHDIELSEELQAAENWSSLGDNNTSVQLSHQRPEDFPGQYVALVEDRVVGHDESLLALLNTLEENGSVGFIIMSIPDQDGVAL